MVARLFDTRLFDTCILIDYLNGVEAARPQVDSEGSVAISVVT